MNLDHTCDAACVPVAIVVSQMGGMLEPIGDPEAPSFLPRGCAPRYECAIVAAWSAREYPYFPRVKIAGDPKSIEAEVARLAALPYVCGAMNGDKEWGDCHTWLADGTRVTFFRVDPMNTSWTWTAGRAKGWAPTIEGCREAAAHALNVPMTMTREAFAKLMGWDKPRPDLGRTALGGARRA